MSEQGPIVPPDAPRCPDKKCGAGMIEAGGWGHFCIGCRCTVGILKPERKRPDGH